MKQAIFIKSEGSVNDVYLCEYDPEWSRGRVEDYVESGLKKRHSEAIELFDFPESATFSHYRKSQISFRNKSDKKKFFVTIILKEAEDTGDLLDKISELRERITKLESYFITELV